MRIPRSSGILLHPTSLPGPHGIGDLGPGAYAFVDFLARAGQQLWQVMPLGPTGYGDSPYAALSAFAGNPLLISLDELVSAGLLDDAEVQSIRRDGGEPIDYGAVITAKLTLLRRAAERFGAGSARTWAADFDQFCHQAADWLDDYALFMALKAAHGGRPWVDWEPALARRDPAALAIARDRFAADVRFHQFTQYVFFRQWARLKQYANSRGIKLIGDLPIFVASDSADLWASPDLFYLDEHGRPTVVAGVPPDYFSATGQRWGNPLYRWERAFETDFAWWIKRFRSTLTLVDIVRLDHFRGFEACWEVPATEETAVHGRWVPGPGRKLFDRVTAALGELPIIVEDLGLITPEVVALREALGYPGMRVLQFAFGSDARNPYLPHNYVPNTVVYTGTHDNDTTVGWFHTRPPHEREHVLRYVDSDGQEIHWDLIRLALASVADAAIVPLQDVLGLGSEARMNTPGVIGGNWRWRFRLEELTEAIVDRLADLTSLFGRGPSGS